MRKILIFAALCASAFAQNFTTFSASNIADLGGNKLALGTVKFIATDANNVQIPFHIGGGGIAVNYAYKCAVVNGAVTGGYVGLAVSGPCQPANPGSTIPANIAYRIVVDDGRNTVLTLTLVQFSGATFNLDNYIPPVGTITIGTSISNLTVGALTVTNCTGCSGVSQIYYPTGTKNGSNLVFTLSPQQSASSFPEIYLNGDLLDPANDYAIAGVTLTLSAPLAPLSGDSLIAYYSTGAPTPPSLHTPAGAKNGVNLVFTLASPQPSSNIYATEIELNGQLLDPATDYTLVGSTLTLLISAPISSDSLIAYY